MEFMDLVISALHHIMLFLIFLIAYSSSDGPCQNRKCVQTRDDLNRKCEEVRRYP